MSKPGAQLLFDLLPLYHRKSDGETGDHLRAFLSVIGGEYDRLRADIDQLYDDWFIETCAERWVPFIGDLVGVKHQNDAGALTAERRLMVANAIRHRRSKGVASVLEQAASEATGWTVRVVEMLDRVAAAQHVDHVRLDRGMTIDVRQTPEPASDGQDPRAHNVDVRAFDGPQGPNGPYQPQAVAVYVFRMRPFPVEWSEPKEISDGCYTFHPLGFDVPLYATPEPRDSLKKPAAQDPPGAITTRALAAECERYIARYRLADDVQPHVYYGPNGAIELLDVKPPAQPAKASRARLLSTSEALDAVGPIDDDDESAATSLPADGVVAHDLANWERPGPRYIGTLSGTPKFPTATVQLNAQLGGRTSAISVEAAGNLAELAEALERALRTVGRIPDPGKDPQNETVYPELAAARVLVSGDRLLIVPGLPLATQPLFDGAAATALGLDRKAAAPVVVLRSGPLDTQLAMCEAGSFVLRLGALRVNVDLPDELPDAPSLLAAVQKAAAAQPTWRVALDGGELFVSAPAGNGWLRAEASRDDGRTAARLGLADRVSIDPERGRMTFPLGWAPDGALRARWAFGRADDLGAGPYSRALDPIPANCWYAEIGKSFSADMDQLDGQSDLPPRFPDLSRAVAAFRKARAQPGSPYVDARLRVMDSSTHYFLGAPAHDDAFMLPVDRGTITIEAANGEMPFFPETIYLDAPDPKARVVLDGLSLQGDVVMRQLAGGGPGGLRLQINCCTVHGAVRTENVSGVVDVDLTRSLVGPVTLTAPSSVLHVTGCVIGAGAAANNAAPSVSGTGTDSDGHTSGVVASFEGTTIMGAVDVDVVELGHESLFLGPVNAKRNEDSLLRACALPYASAAIKPQRSVLYGAPASARERGAEHGVPMLSATTSPLDPTYARLRDETPASIRFGAEDGSELGVYRDLQEPRRRLNLRGAIDDFLPAGLSAGALFID